MKYWNIYLFYLIFVCFFCETMGENFIICNIQQKDNFVIMDKQVEIYDLVYIFGFDIVGRQVLR